MNDVRDLSKEEVTAAFLKACQERPADVAAAIKASICQGDCHSR